MAHGMEEVCLFNFLIYILGILINVGGGCGIWMAGAGISTDGSRVFFATGNGLKQTINQARPALGSTPLNTLSECMVNFGVSSTGVLYNQDYFEPFDYTSLDGADRDLGSGGVVLFKLPQPAAGISTLAITCGKNGNCYVTNADGLGGYKLGVGGSNNVIQVRQFFSQLYRNLLLTMLGFNSTKVCHNIEDISIKTTQNTN
jgi:hypothetical protein